MNVDSEINWMKLLKIQYLLIFEYKNLKDAYVKFFDDFQKKDE